MAVDNNRTQPQMTPITRKVYISACSRRNPEWDMYTSMQNAISYGLEHGIGAGIFPRVGGSLICRERNRAFRNFINSDFDYLLTLDDDVCLPLDAIVKLIAADKDIIGGVYRLKDHDAGRLSSRVRRPQMLAMALKAGLVTEALYVAGGCCMISKQAALRLRDAYPHLMYNENATQEPTWALYQPYIHTHENGGREYLSEDWAICQRAVDIGIQPYLHCGVKCGHWGLYRFDFYYPKEVIDSCSDMYDHSRNYGQIPKEKIDQEYVDSQCI